MFLYYITDRTGFDVTETQRREALISRIADAARAGVDYIQLREKDLPVGELERLARTAVRTVRDNSGSTKLLINSRTDVAIAVGADGAHLPAGELAASEVLALWMRCSQTRPLVGVSAHNSGDVRYAESQGADFAVLAPIFEKVQAGMPGIGVEALRTACQGAHLPVLALGGITLSNARACIEAGASGVAGIRLFQQGDVFETVRRLRQLQGEIKK